jgi:group I intron endonuclease
MSRKKKTIHYIYKTTCLITNRYYIGMHSTNNLEDNYMGSGLRLRRSIRKYGVDNHIKEILEFFESREELSNREKEIVTFELVNEALCMNLVTGGGGGYISKEGVKKGAEVTNEKYKDKLSEWRSKGGKKNFELNGNSLKGHRCDWSGKKHTEETKKKISEIRKGKSLGELNSQYGTCWITKGQVNKKIKKEDLEFFINEGWVKGRKIK